ncbi:DUF167 domain-containing protein [Haloferula rosea]|uniref:UPF0235 protein JIN81_17915 n=1 Tax=Haloferula rosea TaxID=490093 RepID=A0A934VHC1_9BACT|nr:DUF167 domain-containing protein [Haloferula rosea]MBK1828917.1 DUF167 domain-containing protein [Haloferula rosea]
MQIRVKAVPNAKRSEVVGWEEDPRSGRVLRVRIAAPPVEGKANKALCAFLATWLGTSKSQVRLLKGEGARIKTFEVPDGDLPSVESPSA